jgi:hypothetical protein
MEKKLDLILNKIDLETQSISRVHHVTYGYDYLLPNKNSINIICYIYIYNICDMCAILEDLFM